MIKKQCTLCKETKPLDLFYASTYGRLGTSSRCKDCEKAKLYAWRKEKKNERVL